MLTHFDEVKFAKNAESRCPYVLAVDVSSSMGGAPINELNRGLHAFRDAIRSDSLASKRVEVAIVTFGDSASVLCPFTTAQDFEPPTLSASGSTAMGSGIMTALDLVAQEKAKYKAAGITYYRPWVFLITDGEPTDSVVEATRRVHEEDSETRKAVSFYAVGVQGANMEILRSISVKEPVKLDGLAFGEMFLWLSSSLQRASVVRIGEQVPLQPLGWAVSG